MSFYGFKILPRTFNIQYIKYNIPWQSTKLFGNWCEPNIVTFMEYLDHFTVSSLLHSKRFE